MLNKIKPYFTIVKNRIKYNSKHIIATNNTIHDIVRQEIKKYGLNADLNHIDVSLVTDFSLLFEDSKFNGDISQWNTSNAKNMAFMFHNSYFNGDISKWDVSNVENMTSMFSNSQFNQDISKWNVGNVTSMLGTFAHSFFNGNISNWDVSNVEDMDCMFQFSQFNQDISKWNVGNVKYMSYMFYKSQFNNDISQWNVKNIKHYYHIHCIFKNADFNGEMPKWNENISFINEDEEFVSLGVNFPINLLSNKNNVSILKRMIKKANYPIFFHRLFSLPPNFSLNSNENKISFLNFLEINQEIKKIFQYNNIISYYRSDYPLQSLEIININIDLKDEYHDLLGCSSNNFDIFYLFFKNNYSNLDEIFSLNLNYSVMFDKIEELIKFFDKEIKDFPLVMEVVNKFYDLEVKMLQNKNKKYFNFLNKNGIQFSHFYQYYSLEQKHNLIECLNNTNKEIFNDEKMIFV